MVTGQKIYKKNYVKKTSQTLSKKFVKKFVKKVVKKFMKNFFKEFAIGQKLKRYHCFRSRHPVILVFKALLVCNGTASLKIKSNPLQIFYTHQVGAEVNFIHP